MCSTILGGLIVYAVLWLVCPPLAGLITIFAGGWLLSRLLILLFGMGSAPK